MKTITENRQDVYTRITSAIVAELENRGMEFIEFRPSTFDSLFGNAVVTREEMIKNNPTISQASWRQGYSYRDPTILDRQVADLARAGLPAK